MAHLRERNHSSTVAARVRDLTEAMRVMAPDMDWRWLRRIGSLLRQMSTPARDDRTRLVPAATITKLHCGRGGASFRLEARRAVPRCFDTRSSQRLSKSRQNCRRYGDRHHLATAKEWWVAFGPLDMKNKRHFEAPLPGLAPLIERYIEHHRPFLVARSIPRVLGSALWISSNGRPLSSRMIGQLVRRRTEREFGRGRHLNPHLFRKIVPTELAINGPKHVGVAQPLLGHTTYRMTERAYNLGRAIDAARRHHDVIRAIRALEAATRQAGRRAGRSEASTKPGGRRGLGTRNNSKKE